MVAIYYLYTQIDPLLTPRGKKLREGSRAVARQITSDILPELIQQPPIPPRPPQSPQQLLLIPPPPVSTQDLEKVGTRVWNALQNQFQTDLKNIQSDIQNDPLRSIPQRITQQSREFLKEASNVFAETPAGLEEPPYTVVYEGPDYEIREYQGYRVASTNIISTESQEDDNVDADDDDDQNKNNKEDQYSLAPNGAAFNTLAAYLFGANKEGKVMEMTTPVTTTMSGEMRFYLGAKQSVASVQPPEPLEQDEVIVAGGGSGMSAASSYYYYSDNQPGSISIQDIPPACLAVRRFSGFVTKGEVLRQKESLLAGLALDGIALDVPHGSTVPHVVFQYNPPYTLPVLRRNEIAVAVLANVGGGYD